MKLSTQGGYHILIPHNFPKDFGKWLYTEIVPQKMIKINKNNEEITTNCVSVHRNSLMPIPGTLQNNYLVQMN
jgi:hypothetical protein